MANTVQILIGMLDYTPLIPYDTVTVDNNIIQTSDTMNFSVYVNPGIDKVLDTTTSQMVTAMRPKCGQTALWQNPNVMVIAPDGTRKPNREFAGVIVEVKENDDEGLLRYDVHVKSFEHFLDRRLVTAWYNQDAPENIIKKIVSTFTQGFTTYNVRNSGTLVIPQYFDYQKVSDCIKNIADQIEWGWYIDPWADVHFYPAENFPSPLPNNTLNVDTDMQNYGDLEIVENSEQQYNRVFLKGFKTRSGRFMMLTFTGDDQTTQWSTGYRISSAKGDVAVAVYPSLQAYQNDLSFQNGGVCTGGTVMTIKRDVVDGSPDQQGAVNTAYIQYSEHLVRISNYNGGAIPSGYVVAVRFFYLKDTVFLAQNPLAQQQTAALEGTNGIYEYVDDDKSLTNATMTAVKAKGELLLTKYQFPQITGSFTTFFNSTSSAGWRAGQNFMLVTNRRFGGLNEVMFVQRVTKTIVQNDTTGLITQYTVEFADSPYLV